MSTDVEGGEVHILGHFIDWQDEAFRARLLNSRNRGSDGREDGRAAARLGQPVEWERVESFAGEGAVGRPHIALALVAARHVATDTAAFARFLSRNGPAYVEREKLTPQQVIGIISGVGGFGTLAHPREFGAPEGFEPLLEELAGAGLTGMEVYYQDYGPDDVASLRRLADRLGLIPLGGSDYHGLGGPRQREPGDIPLIMEPVERLLDLAKSRGVLGRAKGPAALR
jgi:predicted metal-dependent phosphoesterase TrpH